MLPGADRAEDALKRLQEALANESPRGVILVTISDGRVDTRVYGVVMRQEMCWAGQVLTCEAVGPPEGLGG
jgi:hypothetical protein